MKAKYDEPLSNLAFNFNLRHYNVDAVKKAYGEGGKALTEFSRDNLIPTPFDPRLLVYIAPAVARAAEASGVAIRPIKVRSVSGSLHHAAAFWFLIALLSTSQSAIQMHLLSLEN